MIFVTVGTQLPFDRMLDMVSDVVAELSAESGSSIECVAQSGDTDKEWANIQKMGSVDTVAFAELLEKADVVISHAGMGTIIQCMSMAKPLVIVPRLSKYGEHRNDHQVDTAQEFASEAIMLANDKEELLDAVKKALVFDPEAYAASLEPSTELSRYIADYIREI